MDTSGTGSISKNLLWLVKSFQRKTLFKMPDFTATLCPMLDFHRRGHTVFQDLAGIRTVTWIRHCTESRWYFFSINLNWFHLSVISSCFHLYPQECKQLKNFSSLKAILSALQSNPIYRLRKTWAAVSRYTLNQHTLTGFISLSGKWIILFLLLWHNQFPGIGFWFLSNIM